MMQRILEEVSRDESERLMSVEATFVNRCVLSIRSDLNTGRLTFGEENTQGAPVHHRVAVTMPLQTLQALHHLLDSFLRQMEAAKAAHELGLPSTKN